MYLSKGSKWNAGLPPGKTVWTTTAFLHLWGLGLRLDLNCFTSKLIIYIKAVSAASLLVPSWFKSSRCSKAISSLGSGCHQQDLTQNQLQKIGLNQRLYAGSPGGEIQPTGPGKHDLFVLAVFFPFLKKFLFVQCRLSQFFKIIDLHKLCKNKEFSCTLHPESPNVNFLSPILLTFYPHIIIIWATWE